MSQVDIQAYLDTHHQLVLAVEGLNKEQLTWKAAPESWSVTEVLAHLADHSIVVSFRIRDILAGTTARLPAFNQDAWVSGQKANDGDAADILEVFGQLLRYNSLLYRRLTDEDWEKTGVNAKGETVRIVDIVKGFTKHVNVHLGQIERIKQASVAV
ncbi:DinB family protein [Paenibacillus validus]|uniref:DinB family protein n=1 Tax=Paenibacillus TaxID=44249 RepID=UPI000FD767B7|nr:MULTISPECIES: DinB family protein [Paenibacillus]MED4600890.1 DinB family protein [Paenibacillus validus]MED4606662.1 DinB family protein [Paenibacillus validus]